jgi:beta-fructofuranosidase
MAFGCKITNTQVTSFNDTKNNRRIQIGWAWEDMNSFGIAQQGFQGSLSLPRELFVMETPNVVPPKSTLPGNSVYTLQANKTYTASTLGAKPAPDVINGLRKGAEYSTYNISSLSGKGHGMNSHILETNSSHSYEFSLVISSTTGRTGVTIGASPDFQEYTSIYYDPSTSSIVCNRTYSSLIQMFMNSSYVGYFSPYELQTQGAQSSTSEPISLRVFVDGSLVEIFANDRFAMTSRIYPSRLDSRGIGLYAEPGVEVEYQTIEMWDGLANVWPERPLNSSSLLVFDTVAETNNYTWWSGN